MYVVMVVGVDWKDSCVCVHAWGSTVLPLPALAVSPTAPHPPSSPSASPSSSMAGRTSLPSPVDTDGEGACIYVAT